jgi:hypothetical protein
MDLLPKVISRHVSLLAHLRRALQRYGLRPEPMHPNHGKGGPLYVLTDFLLAHLRLHALLREADMRKPARPRQSQKRQ